MPLSITVASPKKGHMGSEHPTEMGYRVDLIFEVGQSTLSGGRDGSRGGFVGFGRTPLQL